MWGVCLQMKISNNPLKQIHRLYESQQRRRAAAGAGASGQAPDKVELSTESRAIEAAQRAIEAAPEVRMELVNRLKDALARGEYDVDSREVARKVLANLLAVDSEES